MRGSDSVGIAAFASGFPWPIRGTLLMAGPLADPGALILWLVPALVCARYYIYLSVTPMLPR